MIPDNHLDILDSTALAHVATVGPGGRPQNSPVWFDWDGGALKFSLTTTRQKYRNLGRDKRVAVSIVAPDNPMHRLEIRGTTSVVEDTDRSFIDKMAHKYLGMDSYPFDGDDVVRVVVTVVPEQVSTFL